MIKNCIVETCHIGLCWGPGRYIKNNGETTLYDKYQKHTGLLLCEIIHIAEFDQLLEYYTVFTILIQGCNYIINYSTMSRV